MLKFLKVYLKHAVVSKHSFKISSYLEHMGIYYQHGIKGLGVNILRPNFISSTSTSSELNKNTGVNNYYNPSAFRSGLLPAYANTLDFSKSKFANFNLQNGEKQLQRSYSTSSEPPSEDTSKNLLMSFPQLVWPSFFQTLKNAIFIFLIVKPYYEPEFTLKGFTRASKQALTKVSEILSRGDFDSLKEFVDHNALVEVKRNFSLLNFKERLDLNTTFEDIFFTFPYQVGIIFKKDDKESFERVFLEITMCFHLYKGLQDYIEKAMSPDEVKKSIYDNQDRISVANYRFIKEITKGSEDQWTVNVLNHFKPIKLESRF